jgi:hypothetical protein
MKSSHDYPAKGTNEMLVPQLTHVPLAERQALVATAPAVLPAVLADGSPSSDHEALVVTVRIA